MQRRQGVGVSISRNSGLCSRWTASLQVMALLTLCALVCGGIARAQGVNTATLAGTVVDPSGAAVKGAKVTVTNAATGATRTANSDDAGRYNFVGLPPGQYKMSVDGGANFEVYKNESLTLTVGENVKIDPPLVLKGQIQSITVTETPLIEPDKTEVSNTVPQLQIDNLPINGRQFSSTLPAYFRKPRATFLPPSVPLPAADSMLVAHANVRTWSAWMAPMPATTQSMAFARPSLRKAFRIPAHP